MTTPYIKLEKPLNDFAFICRGCLSESGEMKNIYEWGLSEDFHKFTDIQLTQADDISELLCTKCEAELLHCISFRLQCQKSDKLLRETVKKKKLNTNHEDITIEKAQLENYSEIITSSLLQDNKLVLKIVAADMKAKIDLMCPYATHFRCMEKFYKKKYLLSHLVKTHNVDPETFTIELQYYCSFNNCSYHQESGKNKHFTGRKFLNQHYNKVHKQKQFSCNNCNSDFALSTDYDRHIKTCNLIYICEICDIQYKTNERLMVHLLRKHPDLHQKYKRKGNKRLTETVTQFKKIKTDNERISDYICDSPKRSFATQTSKLEENIKNDVTLPSWQTGLGKSDNYEIKTDEISTQTVFEDLLSLKSQTSEDESIFESVSLSDIQTQTFPVEFGLSRSNKETITSETQSPDLSIKETQTCFCLYDSPKLNFRLFDSISSSPSSINLTSTETQTGDERVMKTNLKSDVLLSFSSTETQTCDLKDMKEDMNL